jgi:hypothetical protein
VLPTRPPNNPPKNGQPKPKPGLQKPKPGLPNPKPGLPNPKPGKILSSCIDLPPIRMDVIAYIKTYAITDTSA